MAIMEKPIDPAVITQAQAELVRQMALQANFYRLPLTACMTLLATDKGAAFVLPY